MWVSTVAHEVPQGDIDRIAQRAGLQLSLFAWLGAKHMVTGFDHLLFLFGVIYYVRDVWSIAVLASLFAAGHTITLLTGVYYGLGVNPYIVDAIIGLSVAYKGFDNLNGFNTLFGEAPDQNAVVFVFGLFHGLGLATKMQDLSANDEGLLGNLLAFNFGVEIGQVLALLAMVVVLRGFVRQRDKVAFKVSVNTLLMISGFAFAAYQLTLSRFA